MEAQQTVTPETAATPAPAATAPATPAPTEAPKAELESIVEARLLKLAKEEKRVREARAAQKEQWTRAEKAEKAEKAAASGDYLGALEALGLDPDDFYNKATDQIVKREKKANDPAALAEEAAERKLREHFDKQAKDAEAQAADRFTRSVIAEMEEKFDTYPAVAKAIATGKLDRGDFYQVADALAAQKLDSSPAGVLKFINDHFAPPKPAPAAEAPRAEATPESSAPPSALISNSPPIKAVDEDDLTLDEAFELAKKKHLKK